MTTYRLSIHQRPTEASLVDQIGSYSNAIDALRDFERWIEGGTTVSSIERDGWPIDEVELRRAAKAEDTFEAG